MSRQAGPASVALATCLGWVCAVLLAPACSQGDGTGSASGDLDVPDCWSGKFDLKPDFFAAVPATPPLPTLQLRIQNGGDYESVSDGLAILIDDLGEVRGDPASDGTARASLLGKSLSVDLAPGVTTPGVPLTAKASPTIVHASLFLEKTCRTDDIALYALGAVALNPDGTCTRETGVEPASACGGPAIAAAYPATADAAPFGTDAGDASPFGPAEDAALSSGLPDGGSDAAAEGGIAPIGSSKIVFDSLFDGNPDESSAKERLNQGHFEFFFADPRDICPGAFGPPPRCRGHLTGDFKFYFERGQPVQPFP